MAWLFARVMFAATALASIPLVLGLLNDVHPAFDSLSHFRAHLAVLCAFAGLMLVASSFWKQGLVAMALGGAALWTTLGAYTVGSTTAFARADPSERAVYRLLHLNLRYDNPTPERVLSLIGRVKPDVVALNEVTGRWRDELAKISVMYPYQLVCQTDSRVGSVAIASRRPFRADTEPRCIDGSFAVADIDLGGPVLQVASLHSHWPWPYGQNRQLAAFGPSFAALGPTLLFAGDFNAATWSAAVRKVESATGAVHVAGVGPTWLHARLPDLLRPYGGLPIDHVLAKGEVDIISAQTLESVGSDHLPVLVEFAMRDSTPTRPAEAATALLQ